MKILVNGIGNIGTTLISLLVDYKNVLGISDIFALKNMQINNWNNSDLEHLVKKGVKVCTRNPEDNFLMLDSVFPEINYVFDCTANTNGLKNKEWYKKLPNLIGCSAQGSEKDFGIPYMTGINDNQIINQKYVHIVSCNTHALASLLDTFTGVDLSNLESADFVIVRRSEDLGNHQRLVSANVVSRHRSAEHGTHHAVDAIDLFKTKKVLPKIVSSDITTPSQLMHTVRFNIKLKHKTSQDEINNLIKESKFVSTTSKFDSNIIFELGRRYSPYGRIYSHAIINNNNIIIDEAANEIKGWTFIPQEGNTIISTIIAFLIQSGNKNHENILQILIKNLVFEDW
jgi:glyceraldehyde-3-phosphate dehydrogenase (NAD(P))